MKHMNEFWLIVSVLILIACLIQFLQLKGSPNFQKMFLTNLFFYAIALVYIAVYSINFFKKRKHGKC
jgi:hypothetical protein